MLIRTLTYIVVTDVCILRNMRLVDVPIYKLRTTTILNEWAYTQLHVDIKIIPSKSRMYKQKMFRLVVFWKILIVVA
jgi:hypothetical protein